MEATQTNRRRARWLQRAVLLLGVLLALATVAVWAQPLLKAPLLGALSSHTHHRIEVDGEFEMHLIARHPSISATKVSIANPPWSPPGLTAQIGRVSLMLAWRASIHPLEIQRLEIDDATLHLFRDAAARANWHTHEEGPGKGPPLMRSLSMHNARVELQDLRRHLQFIGTVSAADAAALKGVAPLRIEGSGQLNGRAATFSVVAAPLASARRDQPYHFSLAEHSGGAELLGQGFLEHPFDFRALQGSFQASGPTMGDLYYLVGLRLPQTGAFHLTGKLTRMGKRFVYGELAARSGSSDLGGTLSVDSSGPRTRIEGELSSRLFNVGDLGARASKALAAQSGKPPARLPDSPLRLSAMRRVDLAIGVRAQQLKLGPEVLESLATRVSIDHGVLSVAPFDASLAFGKIVGEARLDARGDLAHAELNLHGSDLQLDQLLHGKGSEPLLSGPLSARLQLAGEGRSIRDLAAAANGTLTAVLPHGTMRASTVELISLDAIGALGLLFTHQKQTAIRCGVASLDARDGLISVKSLVIDTDRALIVGTGSARMASETLDLALQGQLQHPGLALRSAIAIRGPLTHPQFTLTKRGGLRRGGVAAQRAIVPASLVPMLSSLDPGLLQNSDCAVLIAPSSPDATRSAAAPSTQTPAAR